MITGCLQPEPYKVQIDPNAKPINVARLSKIGWCTTLDEVVAILGNPKSVDSTAWYYSLDDEQLNEKILFKYTGSGLVASQIAKLPYKNNVPERNLYHHYYSKINDAKCDLKFDDLYINTHIGKKSYEDLKKEESRNNDKRTHEQQLGKYQDKIIEMQTKIVEQDGSLPKWYTWKLNY